MWNPAAERMFGWSEDEMIGGPLRHIPDGERERLDDLMVQGPRRRGLYGGRGQAALQGRQHDRRRDLGRAESGMLPTP